MASCNEPSRYTTHMRLNTRYYMHISPSSLLFSPLERLWKNDTSTCFYVETFLVDDKLELRFSKEHSVSAKSITFAVSICLVTCTTILNALG